MKGNNILKYIIGFIVCIALRMVPFRPPNVEPIMTTTMPFGKKWGWLAGGFFGAMSIVLYDILRPTPGFSRLGIWTLITAVMYGIIGIAAGIYFKRQETTRVKHYVGFAIIGTLVYDFITGPILSSYMFHMTFMSAFYGQIPFTLLHLGGNIVFAALLSPAINAWVVNNKNLEITSILSRVGVKNAA